MFCVSLIIVFFHLIVNLFPIFLVLHRLCHLPGNFLTPGMDPKYCLVLVCGAEARGWGKPHWRCIKLKSPVRKQRPDENKGKEQSCVDNDVICETPQFSDGRNSKYKLPIA